ncbi:uncharacterized protein M421DRAFT_95648 [Didymella exigua CBS 183.55]|uniref:Piwi domain-containing protein n=1 Tax=Didymella exigua CBS 183.55 TaxID=1150837 RepID=A0A6A5R7D8_9PLEO|nr:uncharacterized protein M421DRAFT_95648 [Didymella exigua CBS 183.55]KAF1924091.1 hypothetical protein M421DRAFT_95648 [Didymella exigua CBS 183.55]
MSGQAGNPPQGGDALAQGIGALTIDSSTTSTTAAPTTGQHAAAPVPSVALINDPEIDSREMNDYISAPAASNYANGSAVNVNLASQKLQSLTGQLKYSITDFSETETRAGKRRLMRTAIQSVSFLRDNEASFATDDVNTIISWIRLHDKITTTQVQGGAATSQGAEWPLVDITDKDVTHHLRFGYLREVDTSELLAFIKTEHPASSSFSPTPTENALNIVLRKCISSNNTLHLNGNKFYLKDAWVAIGGNSLQSLRGLTCAVKPAMGNLLLNVAPTTSAFWRPLYVSEVLAKGLAPFRNDENALRGLRVYVTYDRGQNSKSQNSDINKHHSRIKPIRGFGRPCNQQRFKYQGYDKKGKSLPIVDMTVSAYQQTESQKIYGKTIPDSIAGLFHKQSITLPLEMRARIAEGLQRFTMNAQGQLTACLTITFNRETIQLPAVELPSPLIQYALKKPGGALANIPVQANTGRWNLVNDRFIRGSSQRLAWKLFVAPNVENKRATTECERQAPSVTPSIKGNPCISPIYMKKTLREAIQNLLDEQTKRPNIVVLLLDRKCQDTYLSFKFLTDKVFVLYSICAAAETFNKQQDVRQYMTNIAMKANLKQAGINHITTGISTILRDTLVLGADITHPGAGALQAQRHQGHSTALSLLHPPQRHGHKLLRSAKTDSPAVPHLYARHRGRLVRRSRILRRPTLRARPRLPPGLVQPKQVLAQSIQHGESKSRDGHRGPEAAGQQQQASVGAQHEENHPRDSRR